MQLLLLWMTILVLAISTTRLPDPPIPHPPSRNFYGYKGIVPKVDLELLLMRHVRSFLFEPFFKTSSEIEVPRVKRAPNAAPLPDLPIPHPPGPTSYDSKEFVPKINLEQVLMRKARAVLFEPSFKTSSEIAVPRVKRAPNAAFTELHDRISKLSRVVTAVTLYNGLVNKNVSRDTAIAELMNVEPSSLTDLEGFDKGSVDGFVNNLRTAVGTLKKESVELERALAGIQNIKETYTKIGDFNNFPDKAKFSVIDELKTLDLKVFDSFSSSDVNAWLTEGSDASLANAKNSLDALATSAKNAHAIVNGKGISTMLNDLDALHAFAQLMETYEDCATILDVKPPQIDSLKSTFTSLEQFVKGSVISSMSSVINSQHAKASINRLATSGFSNGFLDLKKLDNDMKDSWVLGVVGPHVSLNKLTSLSSLEAEMSNLDGEWNTAGTPSIRDSLAKAASIENVFGTFPSSSNSLDEIVALLKKHPGVPMGNKKAATKTMSQNIWKIKKKVLALEQTFELTEKLATDIAQLDSSHPGAIRAVQAMVGNIDSHVSAIKNDLKLDEVVKTVMADDSIVTDFKNEMKSYIATFDYFKSLTKDPMEVAAAAELAMKLRKLSADPEFYSNIDKAATSIEQSKPLLVAVQTAFDNLKATPSADMSQLKRLEALQPYSKPLGDSATVLSLMEKTIGKKKDLLDFVSRGHIISEVDVNAYTPAVMSVVKTNWNGFHQISQKTSKLLADIEMRMSGLMTLANDKLESLGPNLESLQGLDDVDLDVRRRLIAVTALANADASSKAKFDSLKVTLENLQSLDLSFAKHSSSLSGMSTTTAEISKVFASTAPPAAPIKKVAPKKGSTMAYFNGAMETSTEEATAAKGGFEWKNEYTLTCIGVGGFCVIAIVSGVLFKKLKKPKPDPKPDPDPNDGTKTTTGSTSVSTLNEGTKDAGKKVTNKPTPKDNNPKKSKSNDNNQKGKGSDKKGDGKAGGKSNQAKSTADNTANKSTYTAVPPSKQSEKQKSAAKNKKNKDASVSSKTLRVNSTQEDDPIDLEALEAKEARQKEALNKEEQNKANSKNKAKRRKRIRKEEYMEDQNEDDTLICVKSIENMLPDRAKAGLENRECIFSPLAWFLSLIDFLERLLEYGYKLKPDKKKEDKDDFDVEAAKDDSGLETAIEATDVDSDDSDDADDSDGSDDSDDSQAAKDGVTPTGQAFVRLIRRGFAYVFGWVKSTRADDEDDDEDDSDVESDGDTAVEATKDELASTRQAFVVYQENEVDSRHPPVSRRLPSINFDDELSASTNPRSHVEKRARGGGQFNMIGDNKDLRRFLHRNNIEQMEFYRHT